MSYVVSARKYRPKKFEDVVGQEHITATLKNALINDKLAHAFLFCGPRGVGKTTCARLLAKVINMPDHKSALADGSYAEADIDISMNIIELDAASNNSVENIRALTEQVRFQPQSGKYKVFIIDEVHMLSAAAFNAFLKTLEEPPPYAIFILATTEKHKILPTILSRCQLYDFRRIQIADIVKQLQDISELEGITTEYDALYTIAEKADGAMRDALSIYDRIVSASGNSLSYASVISNLNLLDYDYFFKTVDMILTEDGNGLLLLFDEVLKNGFEGDTFMNGICKHVRNLMYCKQEPTLRILQLSDQLKDRYINQAHAISYSTILNILSLANGAYIDYPTAKDKRLHIEIALLKICYASRAITAPANAEKKKPEPTIVAAHEPSKVPSVETIQEPKVIPTITKESSSPLVAAQVSPVQKEDVVINAVPPQDQPTAESPPPAEKALPASMSAPIMSSIDDLISKAEQEITLRDVAKKDLTLEEVEKLWQEYSDQMESQTTKGILNNIVLKIEEDQVVAHVPSSVAKEEIQQELDLYQKVRDHFNRNDLVIDIRVSRELFPDREINMPKKLVTVKEKYDHLVAINPMLDDLIDGLQLKPDQE